jgi:hypothetical protein
MTSKRSEDTIEETLCISNSTINRSNVKIIGNNNVINGSGNVILGSKNTIFGNHKRVEGNNNEINGSVEILCGSRNVSSGSGCGRFIAYGIGYQGAGVVNNVNGFDFITQDKRSSIAVSSSAGTITTPYVRVTQHPGGSTHFNWGDFVHREQSVSGSDNNVVGAASGAVRQTVSADGVTQTVVVSAPSAAVSSSSSSRKRKAKNSTASAKRVKASVPPALDSEPAAAAGETKCSVCLDRSVKTVNAPCGHACLCVTCARKLADEPNFRCPLCSAELKRIKRMFIDPSQSDEKKKERHIHNKF